MFAGGARSLQLFDRHLSLNKDPDRLDRARMCAILRSNNAVLVRSPAGLLPRHVLIDGIRMRLAKERMRSREEEPGEIGSAEKTTKREREIRFI